jgi:hypothetical protein
MKMDIGDDRHIDLPDDVLECQRRFLIRAGDADNVGAGGFQRLDLGDCRRDIAGQGVGHRLHRDRRVAAHRHLADMDLAAYPAVDVAVGPDAHWSLLALSIYW